MKQEEQITANKSVILCWMRWEFLNVSLLFFLPFMDFYTQSMSNELLFPRISFSVPISLTLSHHSSLKCLLTSLTHVIQPFGGKSVQQIQFSWHRASIKSDRTISFTLKKKSFLLLRFIFPFIYVCVFHMCTWIGQESILCPLEMQRVIDSCNLPDMQVRN